jgi:ferredoxin-NADP reductase
MSTAVADWPKFHAKLEDRQEIAEGTMAFRFEKPASFKFTQGQFIDVTLLDPPETDTEGNSRGFSVASAPYEEFIMVATWSVRASRVASRTVSSRSVARLISPMTQASQQRP